MELKKIKIRYLHILIYILSIMGLTLSCLSFKNNSVFKGGNIQQPETRTIPSAGGVVEFDNGVIMDFPPGAVSNDTPVTVEILDNSEVVDILEEGDFPLQPLVFLRVDSEAQVLNQPVKLTIPLSSSENDIGWPVPVILDLESGTIEYLEEELLYDPDAQTAEFAADHFSGPGVGSKTDKDNKKKCNDPGGECRCGRIYVKSSFHDYSIGDCQSISDEVSVQFLDCPGQPTEKHKMSEIAGDCLAMGNLSFQGSVYVEGNEVIINCTGPIPFVIGGNNTILGGGPMQCSINDDIDGIVIDMFIDEQISLTGKFDGTNLNFDPPEAENINGYLKSWIMVEGEKFTILDMTFDDETASGDVVDFKGLTMLSFNTNSENEEFDRSQFAFSIPLDTIGETRITFQEEGAMAVMTITMELSY
jgi:hypothetical protein